MGILNQNKAEHEYLVRNLQEAFYLIGQDATLFQIEVENKDMYRDLYIDYKSGVPISLIFEENPKPILKQYQWLVEDEELPYVANICKYDNDLNVIDIRENMLIEIKSKFDLEDVKVFRISNIRANHIDPIMYTAKLVPHRHKLDFQPDTEKVDPRITDIKNDTGYNYLKVKKK